MGKRRPYRTACHSDPTADLSGGYDQRLQPKNIAMMASVHSDLRSDTYFASRAAAKQRFRDQRFAFPCL
jgi:hypothetical protein